MARRKNKVGKSISKQEYLAWEWERKRAKNELYEEIKNYDEYEYLFKNCVRLMSVEANTGYSIFLLLFFIRQLEQLQEKKSIFFTFIFCVCAYTKIKKKLKQIWDHIYAMILFEKGSHVILCIINLNLCNILFDFIMHVLSSSCLLPNEICKFFIFS